MVLCNATFELAFPDCIGADQAEVGHVGRFCFTAVIASRPCEEPVFFGVIAEKTLYVCLRNGDFLKHFMCEAFVAELITGVKKGVCNLDEGVRSALDYDLSFINKTD